LACHILCLLLYKVLTFFGPNVYDIFGFPYPFCKLYASFPIKIKPHLLNSCEDVVPDNPVVPISSFNLHFHFLLFLSFDSLIIL